jgi:hypothetical protein
MKKFVLITSLRLILAVQAYTLDGKLEAAPESAGFYGC